MGVCSSKQNKEQELLDKLYPKHIQKYVLNNDYIDYKDTLDIHRNVIVLFCDICGFTKMSRNSNVEDVARFLHSIYIRIDHLLDRFPLLQKIETIGDCVMIVSGLYNKDESLTSEHYNSMYLFAIEMSTIIKQMKYKNNDLNVRIGISKGPVASGIVGCKVPRFCLFGNTINYASRLQTSSDIGQIHVSNEFKSGITIPNMVYDEHNKDMKGFDIIQTYYASNISNLPTAVDDADINNSISCTDILRTVDI